MYVCTIQAVEEVDQFWIRSELMASSSCATKKESRKSRERFFFREHESISLVVVVECAAAHFLFLVKMHIGDVET